MWPVRTLSASTAAGRTMSSLRSRIRRNRARRSSSSGASPSTPPVSRTTINPPLAALGAERSEPSVPSAEAARLSRNRAKPPLSPGPSPKACRERRRGRRATRPAPPCAVVDRAHRHGALCQRRHVQPRTPGLLVKVVGETDVPAGHTHTLHTGRRYPRGSCRTRYGSGSVTRVLGPSFGRASLQGDEAEVRG